MRRIIILLVVVVSALLVRTHVAQNIFNCAELISSRLWYNLLERYYAQFTWGKESLRRDDSEQRGRQRTLTDVPMPIPPPKRLGTPTEGKPFLIPRVRIYFTRHAQSMSNAIVDRSPTTKESNSLTVVIMMRKLLHSVLALLKIVPIQTYHLLFAQQGRSLMVDYPVTGLGMEQIGRFAYNNRDIKGTVRSSEMRSVFLNTIPLPRRRKEEEEDGRGLPNLVLLTSNLRRAQQTAICAYGSLMEDRRALMLRKQQKEVEERSESQRGGCDDDDNDSNGQSLSFIVDPLLQECSERVDRKWSASTAASGTSSHWYFLEDIFSGYSVDPEYERCALDRRYHELHGGKKSMEGNDWITVWERMDRFVEKIFVDSPENYFRYEQQSSPQQQKGCPSDDQNGAEGWKCATVVVVGHGSYINKFFARYAADAPAQDDQSKLAAESGISNLQTIKVDLEIDEQTGQPQIVPGSVESVYGSFKE